MTRVLDKRKRGVTMNLRPLPIGYEDFKELIDKGCYYVDKTLIIKDIIDKRSKVNLFTRPRRFGKTLNMSMIQRYFEKSDEDCSYLFDGLKISQAGEKYQEYQGQYPVISLSFKSMKQGTYENAFWFFKEILSKEFKRHNRVLDSDMLDISEKERFQAICNEKAEDTIYLGAIQFLSECLKKFYHKNVIILIDEYDVPLESAYFHGFYDEMINLIRSAFESALKTNSSLEFGILTGCLRVSRESVFTGLNNLKVNSIMSSEYSEYFGFTESEIRQITENYELSERLDELKAWYDGYLFGGTEVYNPWSILNFVSEASSDHNILIKSYWSNTSSNDIIKELITQGSKEVHNSIERMINGCTITAPVYEDITYRNMDVNSDYIWSFLLFTGYLKPIRVYKGEDSLTYFEGIIPNAEVGTIYRTTIRQWFNDKVKKDGTESLLNAVVAGDASVFEEEVNKWLRKCISYYDSKESYYHGFLAGLLVGSEEFEVKSNRENGEGRTDIVVLGYQTRNLAVIIEVKIADDFGQLGKRCDDALQQIEDRQYEQELKEDYYQNILKYGIAFYGKTCKVKKA